jgi:excisionase family DNA binding protein
MFRCTEDGVRDMRTATVTIDMMRKSRSFVITRTEAAEALGVDPRTVTAGIENGTIPAVKLGRRVVIPREKFLKLFDPVEY